MAGRNPREAHRVATPLGDRSAGMDAEHGARGGYLQILIVSSLVATGAGLQVAASFIEEQAHLPAVAVMLAVAVPVVTFLSVLHALNYFLTRRFHSRDAWLLILSTGVAILSVIAAASNVSTATCLVILMFAPVVTILV
jgi:hypothetical protein